MSNIKLKKLKITKLFGKQDYEFDLSKKNVAVIIGRNGCGKTTILNLINFCMYPNYDSYYAIKDVYFAEAKCVLNDGSILIAKNTNGTPELCYNGKNIDLSFVHICHQQVLASSCFMDELIETLCGTAGNLFEKIDLNDILEKKKGRVYHQIEHSLEGCIGGSELKGLEQMWQSKHLFDDEFITLVNSLIQTSNMSLYKREKCTDELNDLMRECIAQSEYLIDSGDVGFKARQMKDFMRVIFPQIAIAANRNEYKFSERTGVNSELCKMLDGYKFYGRCKFRSVKSIIHEKRPV